MSRWRVTGSAALDTRNQFQIYVVIEGGGSLITADEGGSERVTTLTIGDTLLLPAACGAHRLEPASDQPLGIVQLVGTP